MFYDKFKMLCDQKGVSCNKATTEMGLSNSTATKWKKTGATPDSSTLAKISKYFGVSMEYLLGEKMELPISDKVVDILVKASETKKAPTPEGERKEAIEEMKAAFWGGDKDFSKEDWDEMWDDVTDFARFRAEQQRKRKNGETN